MNINYENVKAAYYRGQNILKIYSGSTLEWEYETEPVEQTTKQIWYNSVSGDIVEPYAASAMGTVVSNTAYESKCVLEFASDITAIGANAFSGCTDLEYVSIPTSATSIGDHAFDGCSGLTEIYMPSIQSIGRESFKDCAFSSFTISSAVTAITADAFKGVAIEEFNYNGTKAQWSGITYGDFWDEDTWITNIVHCSDGDIELYQYDYSKRYLEFVATSGGTFKFDASQTANTISYSTDKGNTWSTPASSVTINVNSGDTVMFKGEMNPNTNGIGYFSGGTATFDAQGNIMSLLFGDNYQNQTSLAGKNYALRYTFKSSKVVDASNLSLPATTLGSGYTEKGCYEEMFADCTSLTKAPSLPATSSFVGCYKGMFKGCTSLIQAPSIALTQLVRNGWVNNYGDLQDMFSGCTSLTTPPVLSATTLQNNCYQGMFQGCTSLTTAPALPATTLTDNCYNSMFNGCTSLTTAPVLSATTLAQNCYNGMFANCTSLTQAPQLLVTALTSGCYEGMFKGCTSLTQAPALPSSAVTQNCYRYMFSGCTSLTTAPSLSSTITGTRCYEGMFQGCTSLTTAPSVLPATTPSGMLCYSSMFNGCTSLTTAPVICATTFNAYAQCANMFQGCTSLTTAPDLIATTLSSSAEACYQNMFYGCTSLTTAPSLSATTMTSACCQNMFYNCTSLTTAPSVLPATTLANFCYSSMFVGCDGLTTAPQLPATTLANSCYSNMFSDCTSLTTAPELPATTLAEGCYYYMFNGCSSLTQAPQLPATSLANYCYDGMFYGCTSLNYIKMLATDISASNCLNNWVGNVANSGTFVKAASMTTLPTGSDGIPSGWTVEDYSPTHDYSQDYFTIVAKEDGEIQVQTEYISLWNPGEGYEDPETGDWIEGEGYEEYYICPVQYSVNDGVWQTITADTSSLPDPFVIEVSNGDEIRFKCNLANAVIQNPYNMAEWFPFTYPCSFGSSQDALFDIQGNIMSLVYGDDFENNNGFTYEYTYEVDYGEGPEEVSGTADVSFGYMFSSSEVVNAENLVLPSTTAHKCYDGMFSDCPSLTTAPQLPATTLVGACYYGMFRDCPSLTQAPELPAAILTTESGEGCYQELFQRCSSLNYIKMLATNVSADDYLIDWVEGVAASGTFVKNANTTIPSGFNGIPTGWTVQNA